MTTFGAICAVVGACVIFGFVVETLIIGGFWLADRVWKR